MKCDNVERTCTWVGTVGTLEEHVAMCKFTLLPCPKECKNDSDKVKQFMRKDLDKHLEEDCPNRDYTCEHCVEKVPYSSLDEHVTTCPKKLLPCPNGCGSIMERQHVSEHVATCDLTVIACKYMRLGCDRELKRKDVAAHEEDDKLHLRMAMDTTVKLENKMVELERYVRQKDEKILKFRMKDASMCHGEKYTSPTGCEMILQVHAKGYGSGRDTHMSVQTYFVQRRNLHLNPFIGKITFTLLNQLEDKNHYQKTLSVTDADNAENKDSWGFAQFITHSALDYDPTNNTQYLKGGIVYFRVSVERDYHKPWLQLMIRVNFSAENRFM